jgi:hypothetical protein
MLLHFQNPPDFVSFMRPASRGLGTAGGAGGGGALHESCTICHFSLCAQSFVSVLPNCCCENLCNCSNTLSVSVAL